MVEVFHYDAFQKTLSPEPEGGPLVRYSDYAALEAQLAERVKVKPLEWADITISKPIHAVSCFGTYYINRRKFGVVWWRLVGGGETVDKAANEAEGIEAAKAAAQADYESRILSAIEPPAPEGQQCRCDKCNAVIELGVHVPDEIWKRISPRPIDGYKGGGLLCPQCLVDALTCSSEALIDKVLDAAGDYMTHRYGDPTLNHPTARARIKAAMEAGR